ncbi:leucine-rich repeat flightless-interacting protein 1 isoform X4 [Hypomesus transpacificus]|uniref:leucine-rich repeat flightless-interacting protein 1 isoform X4 n=1 Tax=Hypomesus transpacificus TaxID=137520 RepID=UPI001F078DF9|nr:leucine-rich repeat flightless-interacting protein 1 isoform X4 [Hypomesus transpacificus]
MGTQGTGRKRNPNKEKSTAEDDALNLIAREAEARLAAKRAARAEAREIRMKELERQQKEEDSERYSRPSRKHTSISDDDERMSVGSRSSVRSDLDTLGSYAAGGSSYSQKKSKKKKKHKHKDRDSNGYDDGYSAVSSRSSRLSDDSRMSRDDSRVIRSSKLDLTSSRLSDDSRLSRSSRLDLQPAAYASSDLYSSNGLSSSRQQGSAYNGYQASLYEDSLYSVSRRVTGSNSRPSEYSSYRGSRASSRASSARASPVEDGGSVASFLRSAAPGGVLPRDLDQLSIPSLSDNEDRDYLEKGSRAASTLSAATLASLGGTSSRRGSGELSAAETEVSIREIKEIHELKDQIQDVESKYMQNLKEVKDALVEVEEKYRKAMVSNAQLDNEKNNLMYQVDTLKDSLMELEELLSESRREYEDKVKEHEREKHAHGVLQFQFTELKETLKQSEEMLTEIRQLRMKHDGLNREISDLQETVEWKDKKIGALERQKEYSDAIRNERDELRDEVVQLKDILKKHGIVLGPDLTTNGESVESASEGSLGVDPASRLAQDPHTPSEGNSVLGKAREMQLAGRGDKEVDPPGSRQREETQKEEEGEEEEVLTPSDPRDLGADPRTETTVEKQQGLLSRDCEDADDLNKDGRNDFAVANVKRAGSIEEQVILTDPEHSVEVQETEHRLAGVERGDAGEIKGSDGEDDPKKVKVHYLESQPVSKSVNGSTETSSEKPPAVEDKTNIKASNNPGNNLDGSHQRQVQSDAGSPEEVETAEVDVPEEPDVTSSQAQPQGGNASGRKKKKKKKNKKKRGESQNDEKPGGDAKTGGKNGKENEDAGSREKPSVVVELQQTSTVIPNESQINQENGQKTVLEATQHPTLDPENPDAGTKASKSNCSTSTTSCVAECTPNTDPKVEPEFTTNQEDIIIQTALPATTDILIEQSESTSQVVNEANESKHLDSIGALGDKCELITANTENKEVEFESPIETDIHREKSEHTSNRDEVVNDPETSTDSRCQLDIQPSADAVSAGVKEDNVLRVSDADPTETMFQTVEEEPATDCQTSPKLRPELDQITLEASSDVDDLVSPDHFSAKATLDLERLPHEEPDGSDRESENAPERDLTVQAEAEEDHNSDNNTSLDGSCLNETVSESEVWGDVSGVVLDPQLREEMCVAAGEHATTDSSSDMREGSATPSANDEKDETRSGLSSSENREDSRKDVREDDKLIVPPKLESEEEEEENTKGQSFDFDDLDFEISADDKSETHQTNVHTEQVVVSEEVDSCNMEQSQSKAVSQESDTDTRPQLLSQENPDSCLRHNEGEPEDQSTGQRDTVVKEQEASGPEECPSPKQEAHSPEVENQEQLAAFPEQVREVNEQGSIPEERAGLIIEQQDGAQSGGVQNDEHTVVVEEGVEAIDDGLQAERLGCQNTGEPVVQNYERSRKGSKSSSSSSKKGKGKGKEDCKMS